jgi:hypothetical protein
VSKEGATTTPLRRRAVFLLQPTKLKLVTALMAAKMKEEMKKKRPNGPRLRW